MRRQLIVVSAAGSLLVALAFVVPLALLVRRTGEDRAIDAARADVAAVTPVLAVGGTREQLAAAMAVTESGREGRMTIVTSTDWIIGPTPPPSDLLTSAVTSGASAIGATDGGMEVVAAVATGPDDLSAVRVFVPDQALNAGRGRAWAALGAVALALVAISVFVADQLARRIVGPTQRLAAAARRLGDGDLDTNVEPAGPTELVELGTVFNELGRRISMMLRQERELVAELSHRLRTPLTTLRLRVEHVSDSDLAGKLHADLDELISVVNDLIEQARGTIESGTDTCDAVAVIEERVQYWSVLAEDQQREWSLTRADQSALVALSSTDLAAAIDVLIENVFRHTREGTPVRVTVTVEGETASIAVADAGPGMPAGALEPGATGAGSTGLGLDIARRTAEDAGGTLRIGSSDLGGAEVTLSLPLDGA